MPDRIKPTSERVPIPQPASREDLFQRNFTPTNRLVREKTYLPIIAKAFAKVGLPPHLGVAIARAESQFDPSIMNLTGGDLERGGSVGLGQMSMMTAEALGYTGNRDGLKNPELNAALMAALCVANSRRKDCHSLEDLICMYNSGKAMEKAPSVTKDKYLRTVKVYMDLYEIKCAPYIPEGVEFIKLARKHPRV